MTARTRSWALWLFVAISLLLNVSIPPLIDWLEFQDIDQQIQAVIFYAGVLAAECCCVVLLAGLTKRTWLGAYLFGLGLAAVGYATVLGGLWFMDSFQGESIATVALLPAFLLVAASPLYGFRHFFGWRLTVDGATPPSRQPLLLADIFSMIAIVAAALVLVRVPQVVTESESREYWLPVLITCAILLGTSLVILPIHARVAFGNLSVPAKLVRLVALAVLIVVVVVGIVQLFFFSFNTSWSRRLEFLPFLLTYLGAAIGMFYLSLLLLSAGGLRLVRGYELAPEQPTDESRQQVTHLKRLTWWRIGGAIALTMATSIYLANLQQWRAVRDRENAILTRRAEATGGVLGVNDRLPSNLRLGPKATDADFEVFAVCGQLEYLHLVDTNITDGGLAQLRHFPRLRTLSLENMSISDEALVHLKHLPHLEMLQIVNCHVKGLHILELPNKQRLTTLDLSQTQFSDDECELLVEFSKLNFLTLNHTRVTDHGLARLGTLTKLTRLELTDTEVNAERFPFLPELVHLDLSRTRVTDVAASALGRLSQLQVLYLRDTKVTNAPLASLARLKALYHVDLSGNRIDDDGLRALDRASALVSIDLARTQVTGSGFVDWQPKSRSQDVNLDRTLVDDQGVAALVSIGEVDKLSLAETRITDACVPHLAQITIRELDIRGTQITCGGLLTSGLPRVRRLVVGTGQFTSPECTQLEKQLGVKVAMRPR